MKHSICHLFPGLHIVNHTVFPSFLFQSNKEASLVGISNTPKDSAFLSLTSCLPGTGQYSFLPSPYTPVNLWPYLEAVFGNAVVKNEPDDLLWKSHKEINSWFYDSILLFLTLMTLLSTS